MSSEGADSEEFELQSYISVNLLLDLQICINSLKASQGHNSVPNMSFQTYVYYYHISDC